MNHILGDEPYWSWVATHFDADYDYVVGKQSAAAILNKVSEQKHLGNTLELACGSGLFSQVIAKEADRLICTDLCDAMLALADEKLRRFAHVTLEKANCYALPYSDKQFDTVFMANLLHVIMEPEAAIAEAKRVLKPRGKLIVVDFTSEGMGFFDQFGLLYRFMRVFGLPPCRGQNLTVAKTRAILEGHRFSIQEAALVGSKVNAVFVVAG